MFRVFKIKKNDEGQSLVEFALVLPILLLLIMGIIQFGLVLSGYVTISNAAREGARVGIIEQNATSINNKVDEAFDTSPTLTLTSVANIPDPGVTSNPSINDNGFTPGQPLSVKVYGDVEIIVPLLDGIFEDGAVTISRTAVMMVEGYIDD